MSLQSSSDEKRAPDFWHRLRAWTRKPASDQAHTLALYFHEIRERIVTSRYSLDFDGFIPREALVADSDLSLQNSHNYKAYSSYLLRRLIHEATQSGFAFDFFVDVGCGKGQPCLYVARTSTFKQVIGFDFSPPLIDCANTNLKRTKCSNVTFFTADATTWNIPDGAGLIFLYNPFNAVIVRQFLQNNLEHFKRYRSVIAYGWDEHRAVMQELGFEILYRSHRHTHSLLVYGGHLQNE